MYVEGKILEIKEQGIPNVGCFNPMQKVSQKDIKPAQKHPKSILLCHFYFC